MRLVTPFALAVALFACSGVPNETVDPSSQQEVTSDAPHFEGAWRLIEPGGLPVYSVAAIAYAFRSNGTFFRDSSRVEGIFHPDPRPMLRESGTYTVDPIGHSITLEITAPSARTEVLPYEHEQAGSLALTALVEEGPFKVPFLITYDKTASWCSSVQDCVDELADHTWDPGPTGAAGLDGGASSSGGPVSCDTLRRVCLVSPPPPLDATGAH
jgi:hypothetical protein